MRQVLENGLGDELHFSNPLLRRSIDKPAAMVAADFYHPLPQYDLTMARSLGEDDNDRNHSPRNWRTGISTINFVPHLHFTVKFQFFYYFELEQLPASYRRIEGGSSIGRLFSNWKVERGACLVLVQFLIRGSMDSSDGCSECRLSKIVPDHRIRRRNVRRGHTATHRSCPHLSH